MPEWPEGWERTRLVQRARFDRDLTFPRALRDLQYEVERMGGHDLVVDHDRERRGKTTRSSWAGQPEDPGVVVKFRVPGGKPLVFACDAWDRTEHNARAIAKTLEAKRGIERWGCATASREFEGYQALPSGTAGVVVDPYQVLGIQEGASRGVANAAYRALVKEHHPDRGGDPDVFRRVQDAWEQILERGA